jgi:glyoxylase I family protein
MLKGIHHVAVICSDIERSKKFYVDVLGFTIVHEAYRKERDSHKIDLSLNGVYTLELFSFPGSPQRVSHPEAQGLRHIAFTVTDLDAWIKKLTARGILYEPVRTDEYTGKKFTFTADPDGLPIEFYEG